MFLTCLYLDARQIDYMFFKCELQTRKAIIKADKKKFITIFINLVKNAIKYTDKGFIEFGYELQNQDADRPEISTEDFKFYVKDSGIGIPKEKQTVIFERFIKADIEDREARQGAGLGLSITKAYIEMLGGKIDVESDLGIGSIFHFSFS